MGRDYAARDSGNGGLTVKRERTRTEEVANSLSHAVGLAIAVVAAPVLVAKSCSEGSLPTTLAVGVFGLSIVVLYAASALYHALPAGRSKDTFEILDNMAVFLLIAGTYTPLAVNVLSGPWPWAILGPVWALALVGMARTAYRGVLRPRTAAGLCLGMGWFVLIALRPVSVGMTAHGVALIVLGGLAYSIGVGFYALRRLPFHHLIWHIFVMIGTATHYLAIYWYAS